MGNELGDDDFGDQRACLALLESLESFLHGDNCLNAPTVHVLHHQVDHPVVVENSMVLDLIGEEEKSQQGGKGSHLRTGDESH